MKSTCVACGAEVLAKSKGGDVRISFVIKPGVSISLVRLVCLSCSVEAHKTPESKLDILRKSLPNFMSRSGIDDESF